MSGDRLNLTGMWEGRYSYPGYAKATMPFVANLTDEDGHLSGDIIEPASGEEAFHGEEVEAVVAGVRDGRSVDFNKTYRGQAWRHRVDYVGQVSEDGQLVSGMWSVEELDGAFEMRRAAGWEEVVAAETREELPISLVPSARAGCAPAVSRRCGRGLSKVAARRAGGRRDRPSCG